MKYLENALTHDECQLFQDFWKKNEAGRSYVNWAIGDKVLDRRLRVLPHEPEWEIIQRVVSQNFKSTVDVWAAYQKQFFAHNLHIDDYAKEQDLPTYTFVLSVITEPRFRTILWKETAAHNEAMQTEVRKWHVLRDKMTKVSNISETEDLEHTPGEEDKTYFVDYLHLDGIFSYRAGDGVLFNARQYHCTSNWTKYPEFDSREFLQIHVVSEEKLELSC